NSPFHAVKFKTNRTLQRHPAKWMKYPEQRTIKRMINMSSVAILQIFAYQFYQGLNLIEDEIY
ncbi:hypothetical protein L9F63_026524, partial [Diploptera punctata]